MHSIGIGIAAVLADIAPNREVTPMKPSDYALPAVGLLIVALTAFVVIRSFKRKRDRSRS